MFNSPGPADEPDFQCDGPYGQFVNDFPYEQYTAVSPVEPYDGERFKQAQKKMAAILKWLEESIYWKAWFYGRY